MLEKCSDDFKLYAHLPFLSPDFSHLFGGFISVFQGESRIPAYRRSIKNELNVEKMLPEEATCDETHKYTLCGVCVPSPPQRFRYSLKQCLHLPHLPTKTLCPLSVVRSGFYYRSSD